MSCDSAVCAERSREILHWLQKQENMETMNQMKIIYQTTFVLSMNKLS